MADHNWPSEREPRAQWGIGERCSVCGVKRFPDNPEKLEIATGPCPGPGADGVAFTRR